MAPRESGDERKLEKLLNDLDRLVDLLEDMDELGVSNREEIEARIAVIDAEIDRITND